MRVRLAAALFGAIFGFLISWGQFSDPDRIRDMLLLRDPYLYLMMFSAIAVAYAGIWVLRRRRARALLTGEPLSVERTRPERRHIVGAAIFGVGWAIVDSCPAPIATQLTQGVLWSLFTIAGIFIGVEVFLRRREAVARSEVPAAEREPVSA
ncbi:MAG: uncharacterized protein QOH76_1693 [Thermoleophilaceae bacterium]|jgi:uncharacterized membrane protein YedE/YeeE|nr:uncharacterized protein [Thermoleophilaceae bacterium]